MYEHTRTLKGILFYIVKMLLLMKLVKYHYSFIIIPNASLPEPKLKVVLPSFPAAAAKGVQLL